MFPLYSSSPPLRWCVDLRRGVSRGPPDGNIKCDISEPAHPWPLSWGEESPQWSWDTSDNYDSCSRLTVRIVALSTVFPLISSSKSFFVCACHGEVTTKGRAAHLLPDGGSFPDANERGPRSRAEVARPCGAGPKGHGQGCH